MQQAAFSAEKIDQSNFPEWGGGWTHINPDPNGQATMWQTFTPDSPILTAVEIDIFTITPGRGEDTITVEITKAGDILASADRYVEDGFDGLLRFEFDKAVTVVPGELYELKVHDTGLTRFGWRYASNTYDTGSRYVSTNERPGTDWFFQTYSLEPRIIYVDDDAAGINDGTSWEDAYVYLQDALADANSIEKPVEIRVAQGVYKPDQGAYQTPGDREVAFQLINNVTINGGYAGSSQTDPNDRDVGFYETILSGDLDGNDSRVNNIHLLAYDPNRIENSYHVVSALSVEGAILDGFFVVSGHADGVEDFGYSMGGGFYCDSGNPRIIDCVFSQNTCNVYGAGIFLYGPCKTEIADCQIVDNSTLDDGGGIFIRNKGGLKLGCEPLIAGCVIRGNWAGDGSGGIRCDDFANATIRNCVIESNASVDEGGGISCKWQCEPIIENCIITGNSSYYGGGIYCIETEVNVVNSILWQNRANHGSQIAMKLLGEEEWRTYTRLTISYSDIQGSRSGVYVDDGCELNWSLGNIDIYPEFVREGYWTEPSPRSPDSSVWIEGDYHLKSEAGWWDPINESWVIDNITSPCIDAGDPNMPVCDEPEPNGDRINMGAYGGTAEASKSPAYSWFFETTQGPVLAKGLGIVLPHEHIFTDLRGPTTPGYGQADDTDVVRVMAPLLSDAHDKGVGVLIECSSIGVGRNVEIIAQVAEASGLPVVVPTGVYGRANFAPPEHQNMTEDELTTLFISEIHDGIDGTSIKAGFIKIATDEGPMNALLERILRAAGRAASETGAAIASHTPTGSNAVRQVDILESIDPAIRFIWVHAQNESNRNIHVQLAARGAYIEFDSLGWSPGQDSTYIAAIQNLLTAGYGDRILLSHDAGWYQPGSANGGTQKPFTYLIDTFIPKLRDAGVDDATIRMITQTNPVRAFGFKTDN